MDFFMKDPETGKHPYGPDERIWVHYPNTCNVHDVDDYPSSRAPFNPPQTAIETRLAPSRKGCDML